MDSKRRKELLRQLSVGEKDDCTAHELRALLADSEVLEGVRYLADCHRNEHCGECGEPGEFINHKLDHVLGRE